MPTPAQHLIRINPIAKAGKPSHARKRFNALVKKLDALRAKLKLWREELPKIEALAANEYHPLMDAHAAQNKQLIVALDAAYGDKSLSKKDKQTMRELISSTARMLMEESGVDEQLKDIYNRHSDSDFDSFMDKEKDYLRQTLKEMTGVELPADTDFGSQDAVIEAMRVHLTEKAQAADNAAAARATGATGAAGPSPVSARELRQQADEAKLKQSIREIYRKLASALHPDRETDVAEHVRKTALMQRANTAYAANDLLGLLELQLEVAQIDQAGLANLDDDRIKQYNRILTDQVAEVADELEALEDSVAIDTGFAPGELRTPKAMLKALRADIADMREAVKFMEINLAEVAEIKSLKRWLQEYRMSEDAAFDDGPWF